MNEEKNLNYLLNTKTKNVIMLVFIAINAHLLNPNKVHFSGFSEKINKKLKEMKNIINKKDIKNIFFIHPIMKEFLYEINNSDFFNFAIFGIDILFEYSEECNFFNDIDNLFNDLNIKFEI